MASKQEHKITDEIFPGLGAPAKSALTNAGIHSLEKLSSFSEKEVLKLHGLGPSSIPVSESNKAVLKIKVF